MIIIKLLRYMFNKVHFKWSQKISHSALLRSK